MTNMPAITGWIWLKQGASLFRKQPAALTTLLFANILFSAIVSSIPLLGELLYVLVPSLSMAFMQACLMIERGERVTPAVLLTGFRQPVFLRLCKVGLVYLLATLVLKLLASVIIDPAFVQQLHPPADPTSIPQMQLGFGDALTMMAMSVLNVSTLIALSFAAPLTYWQQMGVGKAVFYSFFAVVRNARVFTVLLMAWFGILCVVFAVLMILLGGGKAALVGMIWMSFLFMLLLQCALYAGYRHIFGAPAGSAALRVDLSK